MDKLPPNVYLQSYLQKAGVKFNLNVVDTICQKGFSVGFFVFLIVLLFQIAIIATDNLALFTSVKHFFAIFALVSLYLILCVLRLAKYRLIRKRLRQDLNPIICEAYASVLLDVSSTNVDKLIKPKKSVVIYKECGSLKPRFFTGCVKNNLNASALKEQKVLVFIDRTKPHLYTLDDGKFYQSVPSKQKLAGAFSLQKLSTNLESANHKALLYKDESNLPKI